MEHSQLVPKVLHLWRAKEEGAREAARNSKTYKRGGGEGKIALNGKYYF